MNRSFSEPRSESGRQFAHDNQIASRLSYLRNPGHSVTFSPEGRHLAIGGVNNHVIVVRLAEPNLTLVKQAAAE